MIVTNYDGKEVVHYYCQQCDLKGELNLQSIISDNCAIDLEIRCPSCKEVYILYFIKCKDEALADDLNARLETLKIKRLAGGNDYGYKDNEEGSNNSEPIESAAPSIVGIGESIDGPY